MPASKTKPASDIPSISGPADSALALAGYTHLKQLTKVTEKEVLALHGFGKKGLEILRAALASRGLSFAPEKPAAKKS